MTPDVADAAPVEGVGAPAVPITPDMLRAGVEAARLWRYEAEEIELLVASVFQAMRNAEVR
jgi:hypothetical protein